MIAARGNPDLPRTFAVLLPYPFPCSRKGSQLTQMRVCVGDTSAVLTINLHGSVGEGVLSSRLFFVCACVCVFVNSVYPYTNDSNEQQQSCTVTYCASLAFWSAFYNMECFASCDT